MFDADGKKDLVVRDVFLSVARCPNVPLCLESDAAHPCRSIVQYQLERFGVRSYDDFQLPEPWVGRIDNAPILFVSSNPSIGEDDHACGATDDETVWESHHLAFGGGRRTYILDGTKTVRPDGTAIKSVRYWGSVRARARELIIDRPVQPGTDYALTEIVHCKSEREYGVAEAADTCAATHMERVMAIASARIVIAMGAFARRWFTRAGSPVTPISDIVLGGRPRTVVFLPHPSSFGGGKTIEENVGKHALQSLRALVTS